jgi:hypothetical protein
LDPQHLSSLFSSTAQVWFVCDAPCEARDRDAWSFHSWHVEALDAPVSYEYFPSGHAKHALLAFAPRKLEYVFSGH